MKLGYYSSPAGILQVTAENERICRLSFVAQAEKTEEDPLIAEALRQLHAYFSGRLREFSLPLSPVGTPFQLRAWAALQQIPYGETRSYGEQAAMLGNPRACRAVGGANHCNPIAIVIPCHRVVGAGGKLVGYAGGLEKKEFLLNLERR